MVQTPLGERSRRALDEPTNKKPGEGRERGGEEGEKGERGVMIEGGKREGSERRGERGGEGGVIIEGR